MLSRKLLFALDGGSVLVDREGCYFEGSMVDGYRLWSLYQRPGIASPDWKTLQWKVENYSQLFQNYTSRKLTHETDALDAFRGCLSVLLYKSFWGVICCNISHPALGFCAGLVWHNIIHPGAITSEEFETCDTEGPSWSWISSRPGAAYPYEYTGNHHIQPFVDVDIVLPDTGQTMACEDFFQQHGYANVGMLPEVSQVLRVTGYMFSFRSLSIFSYPAYSPPGQWSNWYTIESDIAFESTKLRVEQRIRFDLRTHARLRRRSEFFTRKFEAMIFVRPVTPGNSSQTVYALAVQQDSSGHWCRIGNIELYAVQFEIFAPLNEVDQQLYDESCAANFDAFEANFRSLPRRAILLT